MDFTQAKVILSREHFILSKSNGTLWCDRRDGRLTAGTVLQKDSASDYTDLGHIWGVIGKLCFFTDGDSKLIVITQASLAGTLPQGANVYCIDRIGILPLSVNFDLNTDLAGFEVSELPDVSHYLVRPPSPAAGSRPPRRNISGGLDKENKSKEVREREKVEKRLTEALLSMFNDSQSFYFCMDFDLTRSFQRQLDKNNEDQVDPQLPWKQVDERFFWNHWMIGELLDNKSNNLELAVEWVLPVIQGYVEVRQIPVRSCDAPNILQPGWSRHYREEREKIIRECEAEEEAAQRTRKKRGSKEVELKDMSALAGLDGINIPLKTISSSGYDYESSSDKGSDDDEPPASFSPVSFTDSAAHGKAVPGIKKPAISERKARACADADILRQHGTMEIRGEGNMSIVMDEGGADQSGEREEEKVWCVVEKEENIIRARIFSDADVVEAGLLAPSKECREREEEEEGLEGRDEKQVLCGGANDNMIGEVRGQSGTCDGQGRSSEATSPELVVTSEEDSINPSSQSVVGTQSSAVNELEQKSAHVMGKKKVSVVEKGSTKSPVLHCGPDSPSGSVGVTNNDGNGTEGEAEREGGLVVSTEHDMDSSRSQRNGTSTTPWSMEEKPDWQDREHKNKLKDSTGSGEALAEGCCNQVASDDQLKRSSGVLISPTRESDSVRPIKRSGQVLLSPTREVDSVRPIKRSSEVLSSPTMASRSPDSSHLSPTRYYATTEVPEVGGVMVDLLDEMLAEGGSREEAERSFLLSVSQQARTHGEASSQVKVDEFPESLSRGSPMGNPFLGQQSSPSWSRHERARSKERELQRQQEDNPTFTLAIISRRSCRRAGTRYRRRGVDSSGDVANYVETELLVKCGSHVVSYVIVRGSVPVYWSQPGYKYRPLPVIEKDAEETQKAFHRHFEQLLSLFKELAIVSLVKKNGREKLVGDAFEQHILLQNNPQLTYITFDFHQSYKANQTMAMQRLRTGAAEFVKKFKFCWIDTDQSCGPLCKQEGAFRVNCMDCLDRTNVVESLFSKEVLQMALQKLGVLSFEETLGGSTLISYQEMWANNGDIISKQYAGTAAMKGDITRYGERKISGMMKDGYNSAHRYYINIFRDSYRQVLIDLMQGVNPSEAFSSLPRSLQGMDELEDSSSLISADATSSQAWSLEREEAVADIISYCEEELFPNVASSSLHSWILMEPAGMSFVTDNKEDEPCVVMYCRERAQLCVAKCDMEAKKVICFLRIPIFQVQRIVIGQMGMLIRNNKRLHMRLQYSLIEDSNVFFTFTTLNPMSPSEERVILVSIAEFLASLHRMISIQDQKISKKRSPTHQGVVYLVPPPGADILPSPIIATPMSSITSPYSSIPSPISADSSLREDSLLSGQKNSVEEEDEDEKTASISAPSSPKAKRSFHRRQRSQSLDNINIEESGTANFVPPPVLVGFSAAEEGKGISPGFNLLESDDSDSESDIDEEMLNPGKAEQHKEMSNLQESGEGMPRNGLLDSKEAEEDGEGGSWKLSHLKGMFFSKVKSSATAHFGSSNEVTSVESKSQAYSPPSKGHSINVSPNEDASNDTGPDGDTDQGRGSQWMGLVKQRLRVNSPNLWRKMRKMSPSAQTSPAAEDLDLTKLEEAHKKCKSRIISL